MTSFDSVIKFWFEDIQPKQWWVKDPAFDQAIINQFQTIHHMAHRGELYPWRETALGRLAEIIVLDQFSRNMYRDTPQAFASDPTALVLAQEAIDRKEDEHLEPSKRAFLYMPFMHSESPMIQERSIELFTALGAEGNLSAAKSHKAIIDRFQRYPHRNKILGRPSTKEEEEFLTQPNSSF